ncbi:MAG: GNAT family N-acetyltransferase [Lachnospiraceae bacterium]|nr:GNAT family N-acetyltransferase [Lachnospiraceae bacterium]
METKMGIKSEIKTRRLMIQPLQMEHAKSLHAYISDGENAKMMLFLPHDSWEETVEFVRKAELEWRKPRPEYYEFIVLFEGQNVGSVSVYMEDDFQTGELGWIIDKRYWHQGIATEAAKALVDFSVEQLGLRHFTAHCDAENLGSRHVMEKLGMKLTDADRVRKNRASNEEKTEYQYDLWL